jgi:CheY-like chemotaxis protein
VLNNLADMVGPKSEGKDLELLYDISADVPTLLVGDHLRLGQVLVNLGNNAVKFTNSGQIKLSINLVESRAGSVLLRFRLQDTGIGMTQRQIDNLFQSFNQADNYTTRKYGGTGLGLVITKTLVEMMGGQICVESNVGVGSTIVFDARLGVQSHSDGKVHMQVAALQRSHVMIVDDNASSRDILINMLQKSAMHLETAVRGEIALELTVQGDRSGKPFGLVLMDWRMPGMDGVQCALKLRDRGLTRPSAVIMVTAYETIRPPV